MDESASNEELMLAYRAGDARAFELLYTRHKKPLYRYMLRCAGTAAVTEELFQDVWMSVIRARERYEVRAKFTTWLYRLAHNRIVDHYRRGQTGATPADEDAIESAADEPFREPDNELDRRRLAREIMEQLALLPDAQREVFLLRHEAGLSLDDIAEVTGVDSETAKSRLRYALAKLRRALAQHAETNRAPRARDSDRG